MMNVPARLFCDESGATMVEYAIMLTFIAAVCIALIAAIGGSTMREYSTVSQTWSDPR